MMYLYQIVEVALIVLISLKGLVVSGSHGDSVYLAGIATHGNDELDLTAPDIVTLSIYTSHTYLSETSDNIYATFIGDFATSGPHSLGSFQRGAMKQQSVTLSRRIGSLQGLYLENKGGVDGWLLRNMYCQIDNHVYDFWVNATWLSNFDSMSQSFDTDHQQELPVSSLIFLPVKGMITVYSPTGV